MKEGADKNLRADPADNQVLTRAPNLINSAEPILDSNLEKARLEEMKGKDDSTTSEINIESNIDNERMEKVKE